MVPIILYGKNSDTVIGEHLTDVLSQIGTVYYIRDGLLEKRGEGAPRFLIYDTESVEAACAGPCILVFKKKRGAGKILSADKNSIAVVNGDDPTAAAQTISCGIKAVTYGYSQKATITFSSRTPDTAVITLQRAITTLSGDCIEPIEVPMQLKEDLNGEIVLTVCAVLLLCIEQQHMERIVVE